MDPALPPPPMVEHCYRHPAVTTGVHCTRCGRPICPDCMSPAPVGHHCPVCIAEARAEFRRGPGRRIALANARGFSATKALIVAVAGVFVLELLMGGAGSLMRGPGEDVLVRLGANVQAWPTAGGGLVGVVKGQYWRLFTSMFLHIGIVHLAVNAYSLYIIGSLVEQAMGRWRFLLAYLITGIFASSASYAFAPLVVQGNVIGPTVSAGASGAIFGIFGAFLGYAWRRRNTAMGAAWLRAGAQIIVLNLIINITFSSVLDWRAHVGGLLAGVAAGFAVDARGTDSVRRAVFAGAMIAIAAGTVALVLWRTGQLRALYGF